MSFTLRDIRKALGMVPVLTAAVWGSLPMTSCKADLPDQIHLDAGVDVVCSPYADLLVTYNPAGGEGGSELGAKSLGPPDSDSVTLSTNAVLSVAFLGLGSIIDDPGNDIQVHGSISAGGEVAVYVAFENGELVFSGSLTPDSMTINLEIASAPSISYLQLVGITGEATIDAFEALQTNCP